MLSGNKKPRQLFENMFLIGQLLKILRCIIPNNASEIILKFSYGHMRFLRSFFLCTGALDCTVGQKGIGETDQVQVRDCCRVRPVLIVAKPQKLFCVFEEHFDVPARIVGLDDSACGE